MNKNKKVIKESKSQIRKRLIAIILVVCLSIGFIIPIIAIILSVIESFL